ncbi:39S ribosomal protein L50, mitochondrial [Coccinella septempunctata]|uniref:39S ribosomal protein L50, mitochondrial n=1 Tax=Coccinella septempunctata TaxID=41139 RepID=UPI001D07BD51|nr:39S ribosomal protein L50, mitochondrial [Coccinella septempunctata]
MAAILRHSLCRSCEIIPPATASFSYYSTKAEKKKGIDRKPTPTINSTAESLAAKGFLRPQKDYTPPKDADKSLDEIFNSVLGQEKKLSNLPQKTEVLRACFSKFQHSVPNSLLRTIKTLDDIRNFYNTPVDTSTPYDKLRNMDLPENLHVQYDYVRFHPDSDTKFNGQTAFNERSTLVTGLKYKGKYLGHIQKPNWPFNN